MFFIGCSTTPVKYDKPVKVDDSKYFVRLKEQRANPVSKKTFGQKLKETFTTKPKEAKTNKVEIKKTTRPSRRIRKTNISPVTNEIPVLLANTRPEDVQVPRDVGKTIMLYLIYVQALIIAIFAYVIVSRQKKKKKISTKTRELNL